MRYRFDPGRRRIDGDTGHDHHGAAPGRIRTADRRTDRPRSFGNSRRRWPRALPARATHLLIANQEITMSQFNQPGFRVLPMPAPISAEIISAYEKVVT